MSVKISIKDLGFDRMIKNTAALDGKSIEVGYSEASKNGWLALIHEYGCIIQRKSRAGNPYTIVIPARSFLGAGFDKNQDEVLGKANQLLKLVAYGKMSAEQHCNAVGLLTKGKIQVFAIELKSPPNAASTIKKKGSSNPLVDSGNMIGAIGWKVT